MPEKKSEQASVPAQDTPQEEAPKQRLDKTIKGGKYIVNGRLVNANGEPIDESGKVLKPA